MYSVIIKKALVIDGTGKSGSVQDVAIEGDKIVNVAPEISTGAQTLINGQGKVLSPGFIDIQNHSDSYWQLLDNPSLDSTLTQGYTSILVGHCGASLAPLISPEGLYAIQKWHSLSGSNINWQSFAEFAETMSQRHFGCNVGSLAGYTTLRRGLVGDSRAALENREIAVLEKVLDEAMQAGAFGLSSGLSYAHEIIISELEIEQLVRKVKEHDGLFSIHLRSESAEIVESLTEALELARRTEARLKISHLKIRGSSNWVYRQALIEELETAWHKGINVHFDLYPYDTTWQVLYSYFPKWAIEGGRKQLLKHLADPVSRRKIISYLSSADTNISELVVSSTAANLNVVGKTISQIAKGMEVSSEEAMVRLVENGGSEILVFDKNLSEELVTELGNHALAMIASDGGGFSLLPSDKIVHPRCFGAAPKFLRQVLDTKPEKLAEAIRKLTSTPAEVAGFAGRGKIAVDYFADLVLFDPKKIRDNATTLNPYQFAGGIDYVLVNGNIACMQGVVNKDLSGQFLRKKYN